MSPAEVLVKVYGAASVARIAGVEDDPEAAVEELEKRYKDKKARKKILGELPDETVSFLAFMDKIGRRLRGERLKKRWFLHGYEDFDVRIEPLVARGIVLVGNLQAREPVSLETALDQGLLQQWLQVTPGFEGLAGDPAAAARGRAAGGRRDQRDRARSPAARRRVRSAQLRPLHRARDHPTEPGRLAAPVRPQGPRAAA